MTKKWTLHNKKDKRRKGAINTGKATFMNCITGRLSLALKKLKPQASSFKIFTSS